MAKFKLTSKAKNVAKVSTFGLGSDRKPNPKIHGGKGAGLIRMSTMGLPVPPGFVIQVANYHAWKKNPTRALDAIAAQVEKTLDRIADAHDGALLFSVRSGAEVSMPGMMDTVLNVGATSDWAEDNKAGASEESKRWILDCRRRFLQMFGTVVRGVHSNHFEEVMGIAREAADVVTDAELDAGKLQWVVNKFEGIVSDAPESTQQQIMECVAAVFASWDNPRAIEYREQNNIPDDLGTAVTVQLMVFGNLGETSGSGVAFSRCPSTGEATFVAEYLPNAQGEDVVAGIRTPLTSNEFYEHNGNKFSEVAYMVKDLEAEFQDMVDVEFTIEQGKVWILQVRPGKRTGAAAFKIAEDLYFEDGKITTADLRKRLRPEDLTAATRPSILKAPAPVLTGLGASPGVAQGTPIFTAGMAAKYASEGTPFIWVAHETNPDHIGIMAKAEGIITEVGGITSHAAVVARGMDKPCITGAKGAIKALGIGTGKIALDGASGEVYTGAVEIQEGGWSESVTRVMGVLYAHAGATYVGPALVMSGQTVQCGHWFRNPARLQGKKTFDVLPEFTEVVLDLRVLENPIEDKILATALGGDAVGEKDEARRVKLLQALKDKPHFSDNAALTGLSYGEAEDMKAAGYKVVQVVTKSEPVLEALFEASTTGTPVVLDASVCGTLGVEEIEALIPTLSLMAPAKTPAQILEETSCP